MSFCSKSDSAWRTYAKACALYDELLRQRDLHARGPITAHSGLKIVVPSDNVGSASDGLSVVAQAMRADIGKYFDIAIADALKAMVGAAEVLVTAVRGDITIIGNLERGAK